MKKLLVLAVTLVFLPFYVSADIWSLFSKTPEECIIEEVKAGMSDKQSNQVISACYSKYTSNNDENHWEYLRKDCGFDEHYSDNNRLILIDGVFKKQVKSTLDNLSDISFRGDSLIFYNKNDFPIDAILVGYTDEKSCPANNLDYDYLRLCENITGTSRMKGVEAYSLGALKCKPVPDKAKKMGYCLAGFDYGTNPSFNLRGKGDLRFWKRQGLCQ
jgi:hypothetical protein